MQKTPPELPKQALSLPEFARVHGISLAHLYVLIADGKGPRVMKLGGRRLVSLEEAARWRAEHTAESAA
jgi:predicted DNA-binding transcriptional regulator AlpA